MFWNNFEKACETKKITPTDAARRVYADDESVLLWERGKAVPSVETLAKLSLLLDTDTDTLLGADNTKRLEGEGVFWNGLVRVCRQKGANPYSVCESIGFSPDAIAMWRRGSIPGTLVIAQILAKLDCSVSDLFYYEELSIREIAEVLHVKQSVVTTRLFRARAKLKEKLRGVWQDEE